MFCGMDTTNFDGGGMGKAKQRKEEEGEPTTMMMKKKPEFFSITVSSFLPLFWLGFTFFFSFFFCFCSHCKRENVKMDEYFR
jgi:hypothetical protein